MNALKKYIIILSCFILFINCSTNVPEIKDSFIQINLFKDRESGNIYQKLSVFIIPYDGDGLEDLSILYIIHDESELFWALTSEQWENGEDKGNKWIGTNSIIMPELKDFPKGEYRLVLEDLSGESIEKSIYISYPEVDKNNYNFPSPYTDENKIFINSEYPSPRIWVYERDNYLNTFIVEKSGLNKDTISSSLNEVDIKYYIYLNDTDLNIGIIAGPYFDF
jgi:hypothetical protein